jgi:hypothetical protein
LKTPLGWFLGLFLLLLCSGGASCRQWSRSTAPLSPVAFAGPPTLDDILFTVNANSSRIHQLSTEQATLSTPFAQTSLRATLAIERPRKLRLRGRFLSPELDLGSNDDLFWFWARSDPERSLYYAYHQQFTQQANATLLPVGPDWMIEAIGLVTLEPSGLHEGPSPRPDGTLEVRSRIERNGVPYTRVLAIDPKYGWIVEHQVLDAAGQLLAVSRCANHSFYADAGASLPHRVQIDLPPARLTFRLDVSKYTVNQLPGDELVKEPHYPGYRLVNLASPDAIPNQATQSATGLPTVPHTTYRLRYRGFDSTSR